MSDLVIPDLVFVENRGCLRVPDVIDVRVGRALDTLPSLADDGPFDLIFIHADKPNNAEYFRWAVTLSCNGSLIVTDNVVRDGAVIDAQSSDASVQGVRPG